MQWLRDTGRSRARCVANRHGSKPFATAIEKEECIGANREGAPARCVALRLEKAIGKWLSVLACNARGWTHPAGCFRRGLLYCRLDLWG